MHMVAFFMQTVPFCMLGGVGRVPTVAVEQDPAARGPVKQNLWQTESLAKEASVKQNQTDGAFLYAGRSQARILLQEGASNRILGHGGLRQKHHADGSFLYAARCRPRCQRCRQTEAFAAPSTEVKRNP